MSVLFAEPCSPMTVSTGYGPRSRRALRRSAQQGANASR